MISVQLLIVSFLGISLLASIISRKTKTPYTILLVVVGIILSATSDPALSSVGDLFKDLLNGGLFVGLILPPLLFDSMMNIKVDDFRAVSRPALVLATAGVVVATIVGGLIFWLVLGLPPYSAFLFSALIAPTDVATVLEIFKRTMVPSKLATLVELESAFNDATGIVVFTLFLTSVEAPSQVLVSGLSALITTFGGGAAIGLFVAWGARQLQRETSDPVSQTVLTLTAVYGAYGLAVSAGVSGLIAVAVAGLFYGDTLLFHMKGQDTERVTREFWNILAFIANTAAFLYVGFSATISGLAGNALAILVAYGVVVFARLVAVYPILSMKQIAGPRFPWSWKNVTMLGGMRGALAIALVSTLGTTLPADQFSLLVNLTFGVALVSILVQGPILTRYATRSFGRQQLLDEVPKTEPEPTPPADASATASS